VAIVHVVYPSSDLTGATAPLVSLYKVSLRGYALLPYPTILSYCYTYHDVVDTHTIVLEVLPGVSTRRVKTDRTPSPSDKRQKGLSQSYNRIWWHPRRSVFHHFWFEQLVVQEILFAREEVTSPTGWLRCDANLTLEERGTTNVVFC